MLQPVRFISPRQQESWICVKRGRGVIHTFFKFPPITFMQSIKHVYLYLYTCNHMQWMSMKLIETLPVSCNVYMYLYLLRINITVLCRNVKMIMDIQFPVILYENRLYL